MEAGFIHKDCNGLLSRQGANHAPGEVLAGFHDVDERIGYKTAEPGRYRVGDSQERQSAGDCVEGEGFRLGDAKSERREDFILRFGEVREHAFDLARPVVQWFRLPRGRLILAAFGFRHKDGAPLSASQPFLMQLLKSARRQAIYGRGLARGQRALARLCLAGDSIFCEFFYNVNMRYPPQPIRNAP